MSESIHVTIKKAPNPNPIRSLGIFQDISPSILTRHIQEIVENTKLPAPDEEYLGNLTDEVLKALSQSTVIAVSKANGHYYITLKETNGKTN